MKKGNPFSEPKLRVVSHKARHLRHERDCLNCGHHIEDRFCSHCGQENTEKRQTFGHLLGHILEDLTHYDGGFWVTLRYLLFRPGQLTNAYLAGKRASFVVPVKLYIFVSFICFFLTGSLPDFSKDHREHQLKETAAVHHDPAGQLSSPLDSIQISEQANDTAHRYFRRNVYWLGLTHEDGKGAVFQRPHDYHSIAQLDSDQKVLPPSERYNRLEYWMAKKIIGVYDHYTDKQIWEKFKAAFVHNIPKALFFYMPFFAFFIWLLHGKKRWLYFDHAIFTLHYFSFLLMGITIISLASCLFSALVHLNFFYYLDMFFTFGSMLWMFLYFFIAHRRVYKESRFVSLVKSLGLFFVNIAALLYMLFVLANFTLFTLH